MECKPSTSSGGLKRRLEDEEIKYDGTCKRICTCHHIARVNVSNRTCKCVCPEHAAMLCKLDSKVSDEEMFISDINAISKCPVDLKSIENLCLSGQFNQLQSNDTQMIASLTSQPYIGLMEKDKLLVLLEFLLRLHKSEKLDSLKFQEKSKAWSVTQLKKLLCLPLTVLKEKNYIHPLTLQVAITKLVSNISKDVCNDKIQKLPSEVIQILCSMSNIMIKMPLKLSTDFIESTISILYAINLKQPNIEETVHHIGKYIFKELSVKNDMSIITLGKLYLLNSILLEETVLNVLKEEKFNICVKMNEYKLPETAAHHPVLFQKIVNMFVSAWLYTDGNKEIAEFLSKFVYSVQNNNIELISLFPENLWPLILLLQTPATDIPFNLRNAHAFSISNILREMIQKHTCRIQDVIILLLIFTSWYTVLHNNEMFREIIHWHPKDISFEI
ncbi:uncharacterized protein [Centruroides vittatus]|uniref:uncharacterized protein n=1 Tax=Centruroides vittatus TaxID=120091 RepID=UPI003510D1D4